MKVRCIHNTGKDLRPYENKALKKNQQGRFWSTENTQFIANIGEEYLVMGIIIQNGCFKYLVDDGRYIFVEPYPLFEITDNRIPSTWHFRALKYTDENYINMEAVCGYYELVFDDTYYYQLVDMEPAACRIYFKRKMQLEEEFSSMDEQQNTNCFFP